MQLRSVCSVGLLASQKWPVSVQTLPLSPHSSRSAQLSSAQLSSAQLSSAQPIHTSPHHSTPKRVTDHRSCNHLARQQLHYGDAVSTTILLCTRHGCHHSRASACRLHLCPPSPIPHPIQHLTTTPHSPHSSYASRPHHPSHSSTLHPLLPFPLLLPPQARHRRPSGQARPHLHRRAGGQARCADADRLRADAARNNAWLLLVAALRALPSSHRSPRRGGAGHSKADVPAVRVSGRRPLLPVPSLLPLPSTCGGEAETSHSTALLPTLARLPVLPPPSAFLPPALPPSSPTPLSPCPTLPHHRLPGSSRRRARPRSFHPSTTTAQHPPALLAVICSNRRPLIERGQGRGGG